MTVKIMSMRVSRDTSRTISRKDSMSDDKWLRQIPSEVGHYLAGFADGEGSFIVSLRQRGDHTLGWQVVLTFNIAQKETYILSQFKRYLGCGRLQERTDGVCYYVCANPAAIQEKIIPFFKCFRFRSEQKRRNFSIFCGIAEKVFKKEHLTAEGLKEIISLRNELNDGKGRKRKCALPSMKISSKRILRDYTPNRTGSEKNREGGRYSPIS